MYLFKIVKLSFVFFLWVSLGSFGDRYGESIDNDSAETDKNGLSPEDGLEALRRKLASRAESGGAASAPAQGSGLQPSDITALATDERAVRAAAAVLGIAWRDRDAFSSVLPDSDGVATLFKFDDGIWRYHERHDDGSSLTLTLAELHFALTKDEIVRLKGAAQAAWYLKLFLEASVLRSETRPLSLPPDLSREAQHLAKAFSLLHAIFGGPVVFTRRFASAFCDMPEAAARAGIAELEQYNTLRRVGTAPGTAGKDSIVYDFGSYMGDGRR